MALGRSRPEAKGENRKLLGCGRGLSVHPGWLLSERQTRLLLLSHRSEMVTASSFTLKVVLDAETEAELT